MSSLRYPRRGWCTVSKDQPIVRVFAFANLFLLFPGALAARVSTLSYAWALLAARYPGVPSPSAWVVLGVLLLIGVTFTGSMQPEDRTDDTSKIMRATGYNLGILLSCAVASSYLWAAF